MKRKTTVLLLALLAVASFAVSCKNEPSTPPQPPVEEHTHTFEETWTSDATYHWHAATCEHKDEVQGKAEHTKDSGMVTKESSMTEDGEKVFCCSVCKRELEKVVIPSGIEAGNGKSLDVLLDENNLKSATYLKIKGTLSEADFKTLREMITLETLDISNVDNEEIPDSAFYDASFSHILLPKSLKKIGQWAFENSSITEMILPEGLKVIGNAAFMGAKKLSKLSIPGSVELVGRWIVQQALETTGWMIPEDAAVLELSLAEGIKELAPSAFWGSTVKEVKIPNSVKEIPDWCFAQSKLEKIAFHDEITKIGAYAFEHTYLKLEGNTLVIPRDVRIIGPNAFAIQNDDNYNYIVKFNDKLEYLYQEAFVTGFSITKFELPETLKGFSKVALATKADSIEVVFKGATPPEILPYIVNFHFEDGRYVGDEATPSIQRPAAYRDAKAYVPKASLEAYKTTLASDDPISTPFAETNISAMVE